MWSEMGCISDYANMLARELQRCRAENSALRKENQHLESLLIRVKRILDGEESK